MPEVPAWKTNIMKDAEKARIIDPEAGHTPDEPATKWFVLAVCLNLLRAFKDKFWEEWTNRLEGLNP